MQKQFITFLLITTIFTQQPEGGDFEQTEIGTQDETMKGIFEKKPALLTKENLDLPTFDVSIQFVKELREQLVSEENPDHTPIKFEDPEILGNSYIELIYMTEKLVRLAVHFNDGTGYQLAYECYYKWIERFQQIVAVECANPPVIISPVEVKYECIYGVELASNVIKVALAANVRDIEEDGFSKLVECVKEKTTLFEKTEFHRCLISTLSDEDLVGAALAGKIQDMKNNGYECDDEGNCYKNIGGNEQREEITTEKVEVKGDIA